MYTNFLQTFGISASFLQHGLSVKIIKEVSVKLMQARNKPYVANFAQKLLPFIQDSKFSPIWLVLLDELPALNHEASQAIYNLINETQKNLFTAAQGSLPEEILHKLWLTHLPSLEIAVLTLAKHVCHDPYLSDPTVISNALTKSLLAMVASRETLIYNTVCRMLDSLVVHSNFAKIMVDLNGEFVSMVRTLTRNFPT